MAATPWKIVSWSPNEPITDNKLDDMVSNDKWLRDNKVSGYYGAHGKSKTDGVKIASGLVRFDAKPKSPEASRGVSFGGFFSSGCQPVVTTGIVSASQKKIWCVVQGPSAKALHPQRDGFVVWITVHADDKKDRKITKPFYVAWHAIGW